eukprot:12379885-Ditylum_brightwellii.AAC.1
MVSYSPLRLKPFHLQVGFAETLVDFSLSFWWHQHISEERVTVFGGWRFSPSVVVLWRKGGQPECDSLLRFKFTLLEVHQN